MRLPDAIDLIKPSVVQIRAVSSGDALGRTLGTGFVVTDDVHVVTAKHVVDAVDVGAGQSLHVALAGPDIDTPELKVRASFLGMPASVVDTDDDNDLALIAVPAATSMSAVIQVGQRTLRNIPRPVTLADSALREGIELAVSGYPLLQPSLVTTAGVLASTFSPDGSPGAYHDRYLGDFTANPGNSGGPVFVVGSGTVVGVCVAGRLAPVVNGPGAQMSGLTVIVPSAQVIALLERNHLLRPGPGAQLPPRPSNRKKRRR